MFISALPSSSDRKRMFDSLMKTMFVKVSFHSNEKLLGLDESCHAFSEIFRKCLDDPLSWIVQRTDNDGNFSQV